MISEKAFEASRQSALPQAAIVHDFRALGAPASCRHSRGTKCPVISPPRRANHLCRSRLPSWERRHLAGIAGARSVPPHHHSVASAGLTFESRRQNGVGKRGDCARQSKSCLPLTKSRTRLLTSPHTWTDGNRSRVNSNDRRTSASTVLWKRADASPTPVRLDVRPSRDCRDASPLT